MGPPHEPIRHVKPLYTSEAGATVMLMKGIKIYFQSLTFFAEFYHFEEVTQGRQKGVERRKREKVTWQRWHTEHRN